VVQCAQYFKQDTIRVLHRFVVPEPDDTIVQRFKLPCTVRIGVRAFRMLTAIQLHNQSLFAANEIDDVRSDWRLPDKLVITKPSPFRLLPQAPLRVG
jgi:hypothetical protein